MYENFVLELEWRHLVAGGNAGVFIWGDPLTAVGTPFSRGIEVQVLDGRETANYTSHGDVFSIWGATMKPARAHPGGWANASGAFLARSTIEVTGKQFEKFPLLKDNLPTGTNVFIALIEAQDLEPQIAAAIELRKLGFEPIPHIPARFVRDEADLNARMSAFAEKAGCRRQTAAHASA